MTAIIILTGGIDLFGWERCRACAFLARFRNGRAQRTAGSAFFRTADPPWGRGIVEAALIGWRVQNHTRFHRLSQRSGMMSIVRGLYILPRMGPASA